MGAQPITPVSPDPTPSMATTDSDQGSGGAGRGGSRNTAGGPLVVVQSPRNASPPRPAPTANNSKPDNSLRNGYAAISHSVSGETAAIGIGFLVGGPVGAVIGAIAAPAALAAVMWRSRRREHDENANRKDGEGGSGKSGRDGSDKNGGRDGSRNGPGKDRGPDASRHRSPKNKGAGGTDGPGAHRKPKIKDPVADKLSKLGKSLGNKLKNRDKTNKVPKNHKPTGPGGPDSTAKPKSANDKPGKKKPGTEPKTPKDGNGRTWLKGRGPQPDSPRPWSGRGDKAKDDKKPRPDRGSKRIDLVREKREKNRRRQAEAAGRRAAQQAARDGSQGDPHRIKVERIREEHRVIDLELHHQNHLLALTAAAETPRSTPVNYPAVQAAPPGTRTAGVAIARQIDFRPTAAYAILRAMAEQVAHGLHSDDDADMADHIVELTGIPTLCKNLSLAVQAASQALARTAPLHPSVIKHLNNAAVAARTAGVMSENIINVLVLAHRQDIIRVLDPRVGEERWNIRNARGTLDAAKLRAAIATAHTARLALPAGGGAGGNHGASKLVPVSIGSTKKLIALMKGFTRGHMVVVLSEIAGTAAGVDSVADSINKLYRRMTKTWPTEGVVDDAVNRTAGQVRRVATELRKAIKAAQRAHARELRLNAKGRSGKGAYAERKWDVVGRRGTGG